MFPSGPKSAATITLTLKSFWTLPMISTAWLSWSWESCAKRSIRTTPWLAEIRASHSVQVDIDQATGINLRLLASQSAYFAQDTNVLVSKLLQILLCDTRCWFWHVEQLQPVTCGSFYAESSILCCLGARRRVKRRVSYGYPKYG